MSRFPISTPASRAHAGRARWRSASRTRPVVPAPVREVPPAPLVMALVWLLRARGVPADEGKGPCSWGLSGHCGGRGAHGRRQAAAWSQLARSLVACGDRWGQLLNSWPGGSTRDPGPPVIPQRPRRPEYGPPRGVRRAAWRRLCPAVDRVRRAASSAASGVYLCRVSGCGWSRTGSPAEGGSLRARWYISFSGDQPIIRTLSPLAIVMR